MRLSLLSLTNPMERELYHNPMRGRCARDVKDVIGYEHGRPTGCYPEEANYGHYVSLSDFGLIYPCGQCLMTFLTFAVSVSQIISLPFQEQGALKCLHTARDCSPPSNFSVGIPVSALPCYSAFPAASGSADSVMPGCRRSHA